MTTTTGHPLDFTAALGLGTARAEWTFRRFAAAAAILSVAPALGSLFAALPAVNYDMNTVTDLMLFLRTGARGAAAGRLSMVLDMFGYYLLIIPAVMATGRSLRVRAPQWASLFTGSLITYALVGAVGAAILAAALPALMTAYASAVGAERTTIEIAYRTVTDVVYGGMWNLFEEIVAGVGWFGFGWLERERRPRLAKLTMVLGLACLADGLGNAIGAKAVADVGLYVYLLLAPAWAGWIGVAMWRDADQRRAATSR